MPRRKYPLVSGEYYHVFNRGINRQPIFNGIPDYKRALLTMRYYQYTQVPLKLSHFLVQKQEKQTEIFYSLSSCQKQVAIIAYCLMPNHFHLLLRQETDGGISKFIANFQNSYTKAFNARHKKSSVLLDRQFKSVHIDTEQQLLHLTRYLHMNPYSAGMITKDKIFSYPWSSASEYMVAQPDLSEPFLPNNITQDQYVSFVLDHADYQRRLEEIKHLAIE